MRGRCRFPCNVSDPTAGPASEVSVDDHLIKCIPAHVAVNAPVAFVLE